MVSQEKVIQSFVLAGAQILGWDHQGNRLYHYSTFSPYVLLPRKIIIAPQMGENSDTLGPQNGYPLTHNVNFTENFGGIQLRGAPILAAELQPRRAALRQCELQPCGRGRPLAAQ